MTRQELETLVKLLGKIQHPERGLPQEVFDALVNVLPFIACELVVVSKQQELLMTWRDDGFWKGWHFPGGLLRHQETFLHRLRQVARQELQVQVRSARFLFFVNYRHGPRGHGVSLVWRCTVDRVPKMGKFFQRMPADIIPEHRVLWPKVKAMVGVSGKQSEWN